MKTCTKCNIPKELEEFDKKGNRYSSHCKVCRREYVKAHYNANKRYYLEKARRNQNLYTKRYSDYKRSLSCSDCNISFKEEPYLCDFHHLDSIEKDFNPSSLKDHSWKKLKLEIDKCIPLCANCHRRRHHR